MSCTRRKELRRDLRQEAAAIPLLAKDLPLISSLHRSSLVHGKLFHCSSHISYACTECEAANDAEDAAGAAAVVVVAVVRDTDRRQRRDHGPGNWQMSRCASPFSCTVCVCAPFCNAPSPFLAHVLESRFMHNVFHDRLRLQMRLNDDVDSCDPAAERSGGG